MKSRKLILGLIFLLTLTLLSSVNVTVPTLATQDNNDSNNYNFSDSERSALLGNGTQSENSTIGNGTQSENSTIGNSTQSGEGASTGNSTQSGEGASTGNSTQSGEGASTGNSTQSGEGASTGNSTQSGNMTQTGLTMDKNKKTVDIESEKLMVMINAGGQVPIYQFWSPTDNNTKFHVKFQKIQEFTDKNSNGLYENNETVDQRTLSLQSVRWILSDAIVDDEQIRFNFTSESFQQSQFQEFQIKIVNHIDLENATKLKFDIYMSGWPFLSEENMLSLRWDLTWTNETISYVTELDGVSLKLNDETLAHFTYISEVMI
ncbi:MAG: hypothetical protein ACFFDT_39370, partial [Candidatus Hodarchaeota archaeon]